ncbi:hypothetical protein [Massilia sp. METH4]|uniref:hypothetical protein n=1 Tax=Massilia sp. METH4 TaxID=3123041 RepID=UPI0030CFB7A3
MLGFLIFEAYLMVLGWFDAHSGLAAWVGSIGTLIAVAAGALTVYWQLRHTKKVEAAKQKESHATVLLSCCYLARELNRMMVLSMYQIDSSDSPIFYPSIADEFAAITKLFDQLPVETLSLLGCIDEWLMLRRIAIEMRYIFTPEPQVGDGFIRRVRNRVHELEAMALQSSLAILEKLQRLAPELYAEHETRINRR